MVYKRGWLKTVSRYDLEKKLTEEGVIDARKVVRVIYGDDYDRPLHHIVDRDWFYPDDVKLWQRINQLWVVPLLVLTIPFQWLFKGYVGFKNESKLGALLGKLTGLR